MDTEEGKSIGEVGGLREENKIRGRREMERGRYRTVYFGKNGQNDPAVFGLILTLV